MISGAVNSAAISRLAQRPLLWLPIRPLGGGLDDAPRITLALAQMKGLGGVRSVGGAIQLNTPVVFPNGGPVTWDVNGQPINCNITGSFPLAGSAVTCRLGTPAASTTLTALTPGTSTITVASTAGATVRGFVDLGADVSTGWRAIYRIDRIISGTQLLLERPLPPYAGLFNVGDSATMYAASEVPTDLALIGRGSVVSGNAVVTFSFQSARFSYIGGFHFDNATATAPSDAFGYFNFACYGCLGEYLVMDGYDTTAHAAAGAPSIGAGIQGCESTHLRHLAVRHVAGFGAGMLESFRCSIEYADVSDAAFGYVYNNDTVSQTGCFDCWLRHSSAGECRSDGLIVFDGSTDCGAEKVFCAANAGNGFTISGASETVTVQGFLGEGCVARSNLNGLVVNAHSAGTKWIGGEISESTGRDLITLAPLMIVASRTVNGSSAQEELWLIGSSDNILIVDCNIELSATAPGAVVGLHVNGAGAAAARVRAENLVVSVAKNGAIGVWCDAGAPAGGQPGALVDINGGRVTAAGGATGTFGLFTNGGTIRFSGVDASGTATPVSLSAGGFLSGTQTVTLNGTTPVAVAWPNLRSNDQIALELQAVGGTLSFAPTVAKTLTGFSVTGQAVTDTSRYVYRVAGG